MGNIYGISNPLALPAVYTPSGDVSLAAGVETTFITTGAIAALGPGDYYPIIWLTLVLLNGSSLPTALTINFKIGAGSDVDTYTFAVAQLTASVTQTFTISLVGANSGSAWIGSGSTINITGLATTNATTAKQAGTRAIVALFRGPDA